MTSTPPPRYTPHYWRAPRPHVLSGIDSRSSDCGLLTLFLGSLAHASAHHWLNAGRTLVDKTYIQILWEAHQLSHEGKIAHDLASLLDSFIRETIQPQWDTLDDLSLEARHQLTIEWVNTLTKALFSDTTNQTAASWLLFYLLPQLPVMPITDTLELDYWKYHHPVWKRFAQQLPYLITPYLGSDYGSPHQRLMINTAVNAGDWWQRLCFTEAALTTGIN